MKHILGSLSTVAVVLASTAATAAEMTVTLAVDNMYCEACPYIVKESLANVPGVEMVVVSYEQKSATVTYDDQRTTIDTLTSATTQVGYPSRLMQ